MRLNVVPVYGENRNLFHVVDSEAPEAEQPAILATWHSRETANAWIAGYVEGKARFAPLPKPSHVHKDGYCLTGQCQIDF